MVLDNQFLEKIASTSGNIYEISQLADLVDTKYRVSSSRGKLFEGFISKLAEANVPASYILKMAQQPQPKSKPDKYRMGEVASKREEAVKRLAETERQLAEAEQQQSRPSSEQPRPQPESKPESKPDTPQSVMWKGKQYSVGNRDTHDRYIGQGYKPVKVEVGGREYYTYKMPTFASDYAEGLRRFEDTGSKDDYIDRIVQANIDYDMAFKGQRSDPNYDPNLDLGQRRKAFFEARGIDYRHSDLTKARTKKLLADARRVQDTFSVASGINGRTDERLQSALMVLHQVGKHGGSTGGDNNLARIIQAVVNNNGSSSGMFGDDEIVVDNTDFISGRPVYGRDVKTAVQTLMEAGMIGPDGFTDRGRSVFGKTGLERYVGLDDAVNKQYYEERPWYSMLNPLNWFSSTRRRDEMLNRFIKATGGAYSDRRLGRENLTAYPVRRQDPSSATSWLDAIGNKAERGLGDLVDYLFPQYNRVDINYNPENYPNYGQ